MNRSFFILAGATSITLALALSTQLGISAQFRAPAKISAAANQRQPHRLVVQVDVNDPAVMNLALNNVNNVVQHYGALGQTVEIEVVAYGPGLHMLREDTSPVKSAYQVDERNHATARLFRLREYSREHDKS